jgi:cytochrome c biogenesis protein CcmG/thiol:disulfide interchange protein DsbE
MTDNPGAGNSPTAESGGRGALEPGLPVGLTVSYPTPAQSALAAASLRPPGWVVPMIVLALVAGLGVGLAVGVLIGGRNDSGQAVTTTTTTVPATTVPWEPADAYGAAVAVQGEALPVLSDAAADPAVGQLMPQITGTDYAGNSLAITANGKAKVIVALAHWCPYCNAEVPTLNDWYAAGLPEGVEVIALSVYADPNKPNFPPATWVTDLEFALPLIADDEARTLVRSLGIPAVPFWVAVLPDGRVALRTTGQLEASTLDQIVAALLTPAESTTTTAP